jgi:hydrogenase expression/formation protein HypC
MCLAVPGRVMSLEIRDDTPMAEVDFGGVRKEVCLQYIPDVRIGEYVVVHVGFAIQRLDEQSAMETLANFEKLGILEEEFGDGFELAARQAGVEHHPVAAASGAPAAVAPPPATQTPVAPAAHSSVAPAAASQTPVAPGGVTQEAAS